MEVQLADALQSRPGSRHYIGFRLQDPLNWALVARVDDADRAVFERAGMLVARLARVAHDTSLYASIRAFDPAPFRAAVPSLVRLALGPPRDAAMLAVEALSLLDRSLDPQSADAMYRSAKVHTTAEVRAAAVRAHAARIAPDELAGFLEDPAPIVRVTAAEALAALEVVEAAEALAGCLTDPDEAVRVAAAQALRGIATEACVPFLVAALEDPAVSLLAAEALRRLDDVDAGP